MTYRVREQDADGRPVGQLHYVTDPDWDARLRAASGADAAVVRAEAEAAGVFVSVGPGDRVKNLPTGSVGWLLAQGYIEPVQEAEADTAARGRRATTKKEQ